MLLSKKSADMNSNNNLTCYQKCVFASYCIDCTDAIDQDDAVSDVNNFICANIKLKRHQALCTQYSKLNNLYVVCDGVFKAYTISADGDERIIHFYFPGEIIGLEILDKNCELFNISALVESSVRKILLDELLTAMRRDDKLQLSLLRNFSQHLGRANFIKNAPVEQQLAMFLLQTRSRIIKSETQHIIDLPITKQNIANYLALAPETVIRLFARFKQHAILSFSQKKLMVLNLEKLIQLANGVLKLNPIHNHKS